jgi:hypothetical protein
MFVKVTDNALYQSVMLVKKSCVFTNVSCNTLNVVNDLNV